MSESHKNEFSSSGTSPTRGARRRKPAAPVTPISNPAPPTIPLRSRHALPIPDAARYLGLTNWFVEEAVRNGLLPFRILSNGSNESVRLLSADDLDAFLASTPKQRITKIVGGKAITEKAA
jgi:hypothetical protein